MKIKDLFILSKVEAPREKLAKALACPPLEGRSGGGIV